jgi:RHS repeat-associated protein
VVHDARGNVVTQTRTIATYNALEQLVSRAQVSAATTTHFVHDRMGNVIAETAGGGATGTTGTTREYIYLYEAEISPTMDSRTVVDRPLAVVSAVNTASPATYWVSVDHLNRPVKMTTATKASVWDAIWQPWGGAHSLIVTGTAVFDARFPGQWFQTETGLHYNWHRSYDPTLGRYTQPDPLGFVDGPSVYGYAGGSPLRWVDRDGQILSLLPPAVRAFCTRYPSACSEIIKRIIQFCRPKNRQLGDLTEEEIIQIQKVVEQAERPLEVVGSAARAERKPGSDIDYVVPPSSLDYYKGLDRNLPSLDPKHGIIPGVGNTNIGPVIRFEPGATPRVVP